MLSASASMCISFCFLAPWISSLSGFRYKNEFRSQVGFSLVLGNLTSVFSFAFRFKRFAVAGPLRPFGFELFAADIVIRNEKALNLANQGQLPSSGGILTMHVFAIRRRPRSSDRCVRSFRPQSVRLRDREHSFFFASASSGSGNEN